MGLGRDAGDDLMGHDQGPFELEDRPRPINSFPPPNKSSIQSHPTLDPSSQPSKTNPQSQAPLNEPPTTAVDSLITRMERNMRIVSSSSTTTPVRPRMSEGEVDEVDGVLSEVGELEGGLEGSVEGVGHRQEKASGGGSKPLKSLRQPAIQPRMNKSTLARLNPPSSILLTPSRSDHRTSRRNNTGGTGTTRPGEAEEGNEVEVEQVGSPVRRRVGDGGESKRRSMVVTPASLRPPVITPRSTRSSDLRATMIKDPTYFSPSIDTPSTSRLSRVTPAEIKAREARIFQGTPGHKRELGLKDELWSLRREVTPHRTNRSADLRRDPTLAIRPETPVREFKARPLPAMYGAGIGRERRDDESQVEGEKPRVRREER